MLVKGGALNVIQSEVTIRGQITLADNKATEAGGGIYLYNGDLVCKNESTLKLQNNSCNEKGGGIMAITSNS